MKRIGLTSFVAIGVALGLVLSFSPGASAQQGGSLIIGVSQCPDGYTGQEFATDCVDPASDVAFFIGTPNTDNTSSTTSGGDGLATFNLEQFDLDPTGPDAVVVGEPATQTGDFAVACTKNQGEALEFETQDIPFEPGGPLLGISFEFESGDDIGCEWYRLSVSMPGDVDPPLEDAGDGDTGGVEADALPITGAGSVIGTRSSSSGELLSLAAFLAVASGVAILSRRDHLA